MGATIQEHALPTASSVWTVVDRLSTTGGGKDRGTCFNDFQGGGGGGGVGGILRPRSSGISDCGPLDPWLIVGTSRSVVQWRKGCVFQIRNGRLPSIQGSLCIY